MDAARDNLTTIDAWARGKRLEHLRHDADPVAAGYDLVRRQAGDWSSIAGIGGGVAMMALPPGHRIVQPLIAASMIAGGADTIVQATRWLSGEEDGSWHNTWYAATGVLPGASLLAVGALKHMPNRAEALRLGLLGANLAVIGYELSTRGSEIMDGTEDASGTLAFFAAFSGLAVPLRRAL